MTIVYYIVCDATGWRVHSRGFTWAFPARQEATHFATDMAEHYALASGHPTSVRLQDERGGFEELRRFAGVTLLAPPAPAPPARHR